MKFVKDEFTQSPFKLEYFEITNENTLETIQHFSEAKNIRGFVVAYAGDVRLIDNIKF
ncbi:MAG: pantoate--beta-alanine ligase [Algoriella sp.]